MYAIYERLKKEMESIPNETEREVMYTAFKILAHWANLEDDKELMEEAMKIRDSLR